MSVIEQVMDEVREWIMSTLALTDHSRVIWASRGETPGPFPGAPCLVLDLTTAAGQVGTAEWVPNTTGEAILGRRTANLAITAYGFATFDWLEELGLRVDEAPDGFCISPVGDTIDVSALQETGYEQTYAREFTLYYALNTTRTLNPATTFPVTVTNGNT